MNDARGEGSPLFEIVLFLVACARDCIDEPPIFGPRRMVDAANRLIAVADATGPADPSLRRLGEQISARGSLLGLEAGPLAAWLDELLGELSTEAKRRNIAASEPPG
jgi:hypothetical protein